MSILLYCTRTLYSRCLFELISVDVANAYRLERAMDVDPLQLADHSHFEQSNFISFFGSSKPYYRHPQLPTWKRHSLCYSPENKLRFAETPSTQDAPHIAPLK
jgi:hypothetical protein